MRLHPGPLSCRFYSNTSFQRCFFVFSLMHIGRIFPAAALSPNNVRRFDSPPLQAVIYFGKATPPTLILFFSESLVDFSIRHTSPFSFRDERFQQPPTALRTFLYMPIHSPHRPLCPNRSSLPDPFFLNERAFFPAPSPSLGWRLRLPLRLCPDIISPICFLSISLLRWSFFPLSTFIL